MGNLAASYSDLGQRQEAVQLEEKVLKARKRTLGDEHPHTLLSMGNLEFYLTNLADPQNHDLFSSPQQPEHQIKRKTRSRWNLRSLARRMCR